MYNGSEKLTFQTTELGSSMLDFWSWAYSDLIRNVNRGAFAEFIVREAMNAQSGIPPPEQIFGYPWTHTICSVRTAYELR